MDPSLLEIGLFSPELEELLSIDWNPPSTIACGYRDGRVEVLAGSVESHVPWEHTGPTQRHRESLATQAINSLSIVSDDLLHASTRDGTLYEINLRQSSSRPLGTFSGPCVLRSSPVGTYFGASDGSVFFYDPREGPIHLWSSPLQDPIPRDSSAAARPDTALLPENRPAG